MVTSILEGPRLVVLFFWIFGNFLVGGMITVVVTGVVGTVAVVGKVVLKRASFILVNRGIVLCGTVVSPRLDVSEPVDSIVCKPVPIVVSLVMSLVTATVLGVSL